VASLTLGFALSVGKNYGKVNFLFRSPTGGVCWQASEWTETFSKARGRETA